MARCNNTRSLGHQRRIPVSSVFDVLHVTGIAVWFVGRESRRASCLVHATVMTNAAGRPGRFAINRIECLVTTRTRQLAILVSLHSGHRAHPMNVQRMKLFAAPLVVRVRWQTRRSKSVSVPNRYRLSPFHFHLPSTTGYPASSAMWRAYAPAVVVLLVGVVVTVRARRRVPLLAGFEVCSAVFRMTGNTTDAGGDVRRVTVATNACRGVTLRTL